MTFTRLTREALLKEKEGLRQRMIERRGVLNARTRERASRAIAARLLELPAFSGANLVHCFLSLPGEVETAGILSAVADAGKSLSVPVIEKGRLISVDWRPGDPLEPGHFNVPEPPRASRRPSALASIDLVLLPGLAFDRAGGRLGYGKGYYDVFLQELAAARNGAGRPPAVAWGLAFSCQIVAEVPMGDRDRRADGILTEEETISAARAASGP